MKRILSLLLPFSLVFGFSACQKKPVDPQKIVNTYEKFIEACGRTQVSDDKKLVGKRTLKKDAYSGSYLATCQDKSGREVPFGGGSLKERKIQVHGTIQTQGGKCSVWVRLGEEKKELPLDENGNFHALLEMEGGGNYIILEYEDFKGTVKLYADYAELPAKNM